MSKGHKAMQWQGGEESDLPHNFAQMVMELEMQMEFEESSSLEVVQ